MTLIVTPVVHQGDDFELEPSVIERLWRMEERHFWHRARNQWIAKALRSARVAPPARFLEVGCGSGAVAGFLQRKGYEVTGIDTAEPLVRKAHERCPDATFIAGDVAELDAKGGAFDAIGFFDVLEHLSDPLALVATAARLARPGTLFVATVPALRALHSIIDDLGGHKKRYEAGELAALFEQAGLTEIEERGIFRGTVPLQRAFRRRAMAADASRLSEQEKRELRLADIRIPSLPLNAALSTLCAVERWFGFGAAAGRSGASLLAVGRFR